METRFQKTETELYEFLIFEPLNFINKNLAVQVVSTTNKMFLMSCLKYQSAFK